mmetsp:Transcript_1005/g.6309  ORF Transcript_1005/g.6309 Transcript_1005/m.6309 type:complete len:125 (-) Transcript_1005:1448-1822(-)
MQTACVSLTSRPAIAVRRTSAGARNGRTLRSARPVVCQAAKEQKDATAAIKSAVISGAAALSASPAFALVDDRMATEGTGKALGLTDPALGWVIFGVFTTIWALYFVGQKDLGGDEDDDSGLTL